MNKKYLMNGLAALAIVAGFSSCVKDVDGVNTADQEKAAKENAELQLGFEIPDGQTWEMTSQVEANVTVNGDYGTDYAVTIYQNNPTIDNTGIVLGKTTVKSGNTAAINFSCPTASTMVYAAIKDAKGYSYVQPVSVIGGKVEAEFGEAASGVRSHAASATNSYVDIPTGASKETILAQAAEVLAKSKELTATNNEVNWDGSADYVINFLISSDYTGLVKQLPSAGWKSGQPTARTAYVKSGAKWTIPAGETQNCGQGQTQGVVDGIIFVEGEIEVNGTLNCNNLGRLVVLPGGKITGTGLVQVNNGSKVGEESYNFGTISVAKFNENFGNFFNYGTMTCNELQGGAGTSCYVNHGKVHVDHVYPNQQQCANLQIKNNCWWEVDNAQYCKIFQNGASAYAKMGSLTMSGGEGGENLNSFLAVDNSSRVYVVGDFSGNNTSIIGPTSGEYAYVCVGGHITQWNWTDGSAHIGMIVNNLYIYARPNSNTQWNWEHMINENVSESWANWTTSKKGNNHVELLTTMDGYNTAPIEESSCAPTFIPQLPKPIIEKLQFWTYAFEDNKSKGDYDMNDVVLRVQYDYTESNGNITVNESKLNVWLVAAGATFKINMKIGTTDLFGGKEVHEVFGYQGQYYTINTGTRPGGSLTADSVFCQIDTPKDFNGDPNTLPVIIHVEGYNGTYDINFAEQKTTPWAIMVPGYWQWPRELVNVREAYPGTEDAGKVEGQDYYANSFAAWAATLDRDATMKSWYKSPLGSKVITKIK